VKKVSYGRGRQQFGELSLPSGPGPFPVAVVIHGGLWLGRYRLDQTRAPAADLAAGGWAAFNVEYRRRGIFGGRGGWPASYDDVAAAIDGLTTLDAPLDLERVVAIGHSAGGHMALWAAARQSPKVRLAGAVGQAAIADLEHGHRLGVGDGAVDRLMGGSPARHPDRYQAASTSARLPFGVPQLLVHGERDVAVPAALSVRHAEIARAAGDPIELDLRSADDHFVHLDPGSGAWASVRRWLRRFED
jgi:acetyl esterase/lipase